jgi:hypothetical protein
MKHITKKTWVFITIAIVAGSAVFALKKPAQREKASHVIVDRLVNQLVCKFDVKSAGSHRYPRGILGRKAVAEAKRYERKGYQRGEGRNRRPIGGDFFR